MRRDRSHYGRARKSHYDLGLEKLTLNDLPKYGERWTALRKAIVVCAVRKDLLSIAQACERYSISTEEYIRWSQAFDSAGVQGLREKRLLAKRGPKTMQKND